jgi:hypothetical protein
VGAIFPFVIIPASSRFNHNRTYYALQTRMAAVRVFCLFWWLYHLVAASIGLEIRTAPRVSFFPA